MAKLKRWYVITPEYSEVVPVLDWGQGPIEYGRDVIEIEAKTKREAIALGVREMLKGGRQTEWSFYKWCCSAREDGCSPYAGVTAERA